MIPLSSPGDGPLPPLRDDLQILPGASTPEGIPTWTIFDPVRHQYFQIEWAAFQLLDHWHVGTIQSLVERVTRTTTLQVTPRDVMELIQFFSQHNLTREASPGGQGFWRQAVHSKQHWLVKILHHYLFFKIPIWNPDQFLRNTLPFVLPLFRPRVWAGVGLLGVTGCLGVIRQWESFTHTFLEFFDWQGLMVFFFGLLLIKILHELGHAYTAVRFGCRVPTMGLGFLIMVPVLYTDTTDSWRLTSRKQRAGIAVAGSAVELGIAMIATFLWNFCPEGMMKSLLFILATTSWATSLLINLNPLLRFDGYYLLSDWWGVPNLQSRSFAFARWKLREWLFLWGDAPPEHLSRHRQYLLLGYAWAAWVYRSMVFVGIAVLVYVFFFKVLGVLLFVVEIIWFLVWPIVQEVQVWWRRRSEGMPSWRMQMFRACFGGVLIMGFVPLDTMVEIPAILEAQQRTVIFPPAAAKISEVFVAQGDRVEQGQILLVLDSPQVEYQIQIVEQRIAALEYRLRRKAAYQEDRKNHLVIQETLVGERKALQGLLRLRDQLTLRAPFTGVVTDLASSLHSGRWVNTEMALVYLINSTSVVVALATEKEQARLAIGNEGRFYPDDPARPAREGRIRDIRHMDESYVELPHFASIYSGDIPVRQDSHNMLVPEYSIYRIEVDVADQEAFWNQIVRGMIHIEGQPLSVMGHFWERAASVLIRESGV